MVSEKIQKISRIILIFILAFIWGNSLLDASKSAQISSGVKEIILETVEIITETDLSNIINDYTIRKIAHFTQFAMLGFFTILSFPKKYLFINIFGIFVSSTDELIQLFIPGRGPQIIDIFIDILGFTIGFLICYLIIKLLDRKN